MTIIVTLNVGSSSVKFAAFAAAREGAALARGEVDGFGTESRFTASLGSAGASEQEAEDEIKDHASAVQTALKWLGKAIAGEKVVAVGHRVVHGGARHSEPVLIEHEVFAELAALTSLAPLHQPHNLAGVRAAQAFFPGIPQVACFDTAFHRSHPFVADVFAIPKSFYRQGVRRYGFHGLSYEYVAMALREIDPDRAYGRVVIAHLGNGASMCAVKDGRSIASTMGFSALEGLPMGTRCGELDPGVLLYLLQERGMTAAEVTSLLYKQSGLLGLSGLSHDMRTLEASPSQDARNAIDYFVYRTRRELGAMTAILGGIDIVAFTGGIGENSAAIRARVCEQMDWLGLALDDEANRRKRSKISTGTSRVQVYVVPTDEEKMIARHTRDVLRLSPATR